MENKRIIAFGDIHGCYKAAETAVKLAKDNNALAIFLGDYVDRGLYSIKTLEVLIEAKKRNPEWIFLRGNHDQMLLDLIFEKQKPNSIFDVISGKTSNEETSKVFFQWKTCNDTLQQEIVTFLNDTKFYHETEHWIFVHAPLKDSTVPLIKKTKEELIWPYELNPIWEGKQFIHGHATVNNPTTTNKGTNINTLCGYGGFLTGMLLLISYPLVPSNIVREERFVSFSISEDGVLMNLSQP